MVSGAAKMWKGDQINYKHKQKGSWWGNSHEGYPHRGSSRARKGGFERVVQKKKSREYIKNYWKEGYGRMAYNYIKNNYTPPVAAVINPENGKVTSRISETLAIFRNC